MGLKEETELVSKLRELAHTAHDIRLDSRQFAELARLAWHDTLVRKENRHEPTA